MTTPLTQDIQDLDIWDADDSMNAESIRKKAPQYHFLQKLETYDDEIMHYLLYNICLKVIPPWEYYCKNKKLRSSIIAFKKFLDKKYWIDNLRHYTQSAIQTSQKDCTYIDTSSASEAVFYSLKTIVDNDILFATFALSNGATANSCREDDYLTWIKEIALPQAFKKEICNLEQMQMYCYPLYKELYVDLFEELDRI